MKKIFLLLLLPLLFLNFSVAENVSINGITNYNCYYLSSSIKYSYIECLNQTFLYKCENSYFDTKEECLSELSKLDQQPALLRDLRMNVYYIGGLFYSSNPIVGFISLIILILFISLLIKYLRNKKLVKR